MASRNRRSITAVEDGLAATLSDGRELARFTGRHAKRDALRYLAGTKPLRGHPSIDKVRRAREELGR